MTVIYSILPVRLKHHSLSLAMSWFWSILSLMGAVRWCLRENTNNTSNFATLATVEVL